VWCSSNQIFTQKIGVDGSPVQVTNDANQCEVPQVSGDRVVWQDVVSANWQIFTQQIGVDSSPATLTSGAAPDESPEVSGDRVVWEGKVGANWQVFTQKIGVDGSPVQLTTDAHDHESPEVSGNRVVWFASNGTNDQIFRAKLITTPSIVRSPDTSSITVKREKGSAKYTLSATLRDTDGTLVCGARLYLETSMNGKTNWKNSYALKTNSAGVASKAFKSKKAGTVYYRWYAPASTGYRKVYSAKQKVHVE
jgi:hypothetical protein